MYQKKIENENKNKIIKITISTKKRRKATEEKFRFSLDPFELLDDKSLKRSDYKLISSPGLTVSNINDNIKYIQSGTWVYEKKENNLNAKTATNKKQPSRRKRSTTSRSRRKKELKPTEENKLLRTEELERVPPQA
tara:strand:+ start:281 stop:688 length:408 start_codon:yes stop_codon:yes gene_type:complete